MPYRECHILDLWLKHVKSTNIIRKNSKTSLTRQDIHREGVECMLPRKDVLLNDRGYLDVGYPMSYEDTSIPLFPSIP
jgi:hypothetical protein